jgi:hypothetical protein
MWQYEQDSGKLSRDGVLVSTGYSGNGRGKNNPSMEAAPGVGPIPHGKWGIVSVADSPNTGPFTITLFPEPCTDTHGRSDFRIHGDSISHPGNASHGCIIMPRVVRNKIWSSGDRLLTVVP